MQEAAVEAWRICETLGEWRPDGAMKELQSYALGAEVAHGNWPASVLAQMANDSKSHIYMWKDRLVRLLGEPGLSSKDALAFMKVLGPGGAPMDDVLNRCSEEPDDGRIFVDVAHLALEFEDLIGAIRASGMALQHREGHCFRNVRILHTCAERIAKTALTIDGRDEADRFSDADLLAN
jgi:hypothetical protein